MSYKCELRDTLDQSHHFSTLINVYEDTHRYQQVSQNLLTLSQYLQSECNMTVRTLQSASQSDLRTLQVI